MPKLVDHAQRRVQIAEAAWRVLMRDGLQKTTVRSIVAESGLSSGAIRHYFSSQDELLHFVETLVIERVAQRLREVMRDDRLSPLEQATRLCQELLPLDESRAAELTVSTAMAERTRLDEAHRAYRREQWEGIRTTTRTAVALLARSVQEEAGAAPQPPAPALHERLAARLHLILDGLAAQHVLYPGLLAAAEVTAALEEAIADIRRELAGSAAR